MSSELSRLLAREPRKRRPIRCELPGAPSAEEAVRPRYLELHTKRQRLRRNVALRDRPLNLPRTPSGAIIESCLVAGGTRGPGFPVPSSGLPVLHSDAAQAILNRFIRKISTAPWYSADGN